ncbi:MAG: proline dehydrogenase family protein [Planctomycetota bacterium]|nr:proline dehydrogenase family protein [Planctomycetota bacterium]
MNPLIRIIPASLVRFFAKPYVAGDSLEKAMSVVAELRAERGLLSTLDLLAEDIREPEQVRRNLEAYLAMVDAAVSVPAADRPTLSLKPSSYTTSPLHEGGDASGSREAMWQIIQKAQAHDVDVSIDMEGRQWTDFTLSALERFHADGARNVGCVLQTRLHRTEQDLAALPDGVRVRLVIGIYQEPSDVALTDKAAMKERMLSHAEQLLRRGHYVEFATHDVHCVRRFLEEVVPRVGVGPDRFEVQMLYGVPRDRFLADLLRQNVKCRLYVPFALGWDLAIEYLRRRLDEYPAMMWLVTKNMFWRR